MFELIIWLFFFSFMCHLSIPHLWTTARWSGTTSEAGPFPDNSLTVHRWSLGFCVSPRWKAKTFSLPTTWSTLQVNYVCVKDFSPLWSSSPRKLKVALDWLHNSAWQLVSQLCLNADNLKDFISQCHFLENNSLFSTWGRVPLCSQN